MLNYSYVSDTTMFKLLFIVSWTLWTFTFVPPSQLQSTQRATTADPELTAKIDRLLENQNKMVENQDKFDRVLENQDKMSADLESCGGLQDGESERPDDDSSCPTQPNTNLKKFRCDGVTDSSTEGGISTVNVNGKPIQFHCDRETEFYPFTDWIVFLRRVDGQVIFHNRTWNETKHGFGDVEGSYWMGLDNIHSLTQNARMMLKIDLEDFEGNKRFAEYDDFAVSPEWFKYRLDIGEYSGDAGDSLSSHNGQAFSTWDQDSGGNDCASRYPGAWWYSNCGNSNLMGEYLNGTHTKAHSGVYWNHWKGHSYSYKTATMKMRPYP